MTEQKKYESSFKVLMPGNAKESEYRITVLADNQVDATQKAIEAWRQATEPRDIRIKEIQKIQVGS